MEYQEQNLIRIRVSTRLQDSPPKRSKDFILGIFFVDYLKDSYSMELPRILYSRADLVDVEFEYTTGFDVTLFENQLLAWAHRNTLDLFPNSHNFQN